MTQGTEQRRLVRLAGRMNRRSEAVGAPGHIRAEDLALILMRSDHCHYCGIGLERGQGSFDHAVPLDRAGENLPSNIVLACYTCQHTKFNKTPEEMRAYEGVVMTCIVCGKQYKPRHVEWKAGRARTCSRSCAAKSRFRRATV